MHPYNLHPSVAFPQTGDTGEFVFRCALGKAHSLHRDIYISIDAVLAKGVPLGSHQDIPYLGREIPQNSSFCGWEYVFTALMFSFVFPHRSDGAERLIAQNVHSARRMGISPEKQGVGYLRDRISKKLFQMAKPIRIANPFISASERRSRTHESS